MLGKPTVMLAPQARKGNGGLASAKQRSAIKVSAPKPPYGNNLLNQTKQAINETKPTLPIHHRYWRIGQTSDKNTSLLRQLKHFFLKQRFNQKICTFKREVPVVPNHWHAILSKDTAAY